VVFWVGVGATVVAAGASGFFMLKTKSNHDDFVSAGCDKAPFAGCDTKKSDGDSMQTTANIALGVTAGLALVVTVIGVAFTDWKTGKSAAALRVLVPSAGGAACSLRF
jgi:hypothetical protein